MTVFGGTMGALIGLPPSLVEIYGSDIKKVYQANGVPLSLGLVLTNLSAFLHLFLMSILLYLLAPVLFDAALPAYPGQYFAELAFFLVVSLSIASIVGLAVKDPAKTSMVSILLFLPSILLSGILFPAELLPEAVATVGKLFPATWGYSLLTEQASTGEPVAPLLLLLTLGVVACGLLLRKIRTRQ